MSDRRKATTFRLPPAPRGYPIIGNMLQLGKMPHLTLTNLSKTYGPIMSLKLGSTTTILISSSTMAKEVLKTHDEIFVDRPVLDAMRALDHHEYSIAVLPASEKWRYLRKILTMEMFTSQRLNGSQELRQAKVTQLLDHVDKCCENNQTVLVGRASFITSLNFISNTLFSKDVASYDDSHASNEFYELTRGIMVQTGLPNISDYFPSLRWCDPQGLRQKTKLMMEKMAAMIEKIVNQRLQDGTSPTHNDMLDNLLKIQKEDVSEFNRKDLDHFLLLDVVPVRIRCLCIGSASTVGIELPTSYVVRSGLLLFLQMGEKVVTE
ncbi:Cytochrome P450 [Dillenia turbinata]|uniref:Cytochrome P450 n=1 Tax=Dillenia turbinata TaxID=194707 RepID=A0AAN8V2J3_9MAGN